jgi:hypothetical protein
MSYIYERPSNECHLTSGCPLFYSQDGPCSGAYFYNEKNEVMAMHETGSGGTFVCARRGAIKRNDHKLEATL